MNDKEYNLSKIIMEVGAKNASKEIQNFAADLDFLSSGVESRFEDITNNIDKVVEHLDVTKYKIEMSDIFQIRNYLKQLEQSLTVMKENFGKIKSYKLRIFVNLLEKQYRFKIARSYEILKRFSEKGDLSPNEYKHLLERYDSIDESIRQELMDCLVGKLTKDEYRTLIAKFDDSDNTVGKQFIKTMMLVIAMYETM